MPAGARKGIFSGSVFALDGLPTPVAAYALHRLSRNYSGHLITVRRSSDNAIQSFGANQPEINISEIQTWVGSGNSGFVTQWFDQSGGNRHIGSVSSSAEPTMVESGNFVLLQTGSKPALNFNLNKGLQQNVAPYVCSDILSVCRSASATFTQFHTPFNNVLEDIGTLLRRLPSFSRFSAGAFHNVPFPNSARRNGVIINPQSTDALSPITSAFVLSTQSPNIYTHNFIQIGNWFTDNLRGACLQSCAIAFANPLSLTDMVTIEQRLMNYYGII
jgi:hypothetical protein